jgi:hypothetical protein
MKLKTRGEFLCIDTRLFNALNHAGLSFIWDYKNKGLKFENKSDFEHAMRLKEETEKLTDINQEVISDKLNIISNVSKVTKKGKLF